MSWLYTSLFAFIIYADALSFIPMISYWDEAMAIAIIVIHICRSSYLGKNGINKEKAENYLLISLVMASGIIGNVLHPGIQNSSAAILKDIVAFLKFPLLMTVLINTRDTYYIKHRLLILKKVCRLSRLTIATSAALAFIGYFINIGVYTDEVRFLKCYRFVFSHPTFLVANIVFCVSMLLLESRKKNKWFIYIACVLLFLSQRFKAYAIIAIILVVMLAKERTISRLFSLQKSKTKLRTKYVLPSFAAIIIVVYFVFRKRFATYLSWGMSSARLAMIVVSVRMALDFFPFGSGFGTFASFLSGRYYSKIYTMYGLSHIYGLRPEQYNFVSDTFWPWVLGQFGVFAAIAYVLLYYRLIKTQLISIKNRGRLLAFIVLWMYALLASTMEAYFTNSTGVAMAVILMLYVGNDSAFYIKRKISANN